MSTVILASRTHAEHLITKVDTRYTHPLISNQDILREVLQMLLDADVSRDEKTYRDALASCARVCRAFHDPAAERLWRSLPTLDPLIKLLPYTTIQTGSPTTFVRSISKVSRTCIVTYMTLSVNQ